MKSNPYSDSLYKLMAGNVEKTQMKSMRKKKHSFRWVFILLIIAALGVLWLYLIFKGII